MTVPAAAAAAEAAAAKAVLPGGMAFFSGVLPDNQSTVIIGFDCSA
jgi:hypothetical protein